MKYTHSWGHHHTAPPEYCVQWSYCNVGNIMTMRLHFNIRCKCKDPWIYVFIHVTHPHTQHVSIPGVKGASVCETTPSVVPSAVLKLPTVCHEQGTKCQVTQTFQTHFFCLPPQATANSQQSEGCRVGVV